jgi:hypothetical protein
MFKRARHQFGWLEKRKRKRGPEVWVWRYHTDATVVKAPSQRLSLEM